MIMSVVLTQETTESSWQLQPLSYNLHTTNIAYLILLLHIVSLNMLLIILTNVMKLQELLLKIIEVHQSKLLMLLDQKKVEKVYLLLGDQHAFNMGSVGLAL